MAIAAKQQDERQHQPDGRLGLLPWRLGVCRVGSGRLVPIESGTVRPTGGGGHDVADDQHQNQPRHASIRCSLRRLLLRHDLVVLLGPLPLLPDRAARVRKEPIDWSKSSAADKLPAGRAICYIASDAPRAPWRRRWKLTRAQARALRRPRPIERGSTCLAPGRGRQRRRAQQPPREKRRPAPSLALRAGSLRFGLVVASGTPHRMR